MRVQQERDALRVVARNVQKRRGGRKKKRKKNRKRKGKKRGRVRHMTNEREFEILSIPEHDKNVRYVVHTTVVHVLQFFVCRGHEMQPGCYQ